LILASAIEKQLRRRVAPGKPDACIILLTMRRLVYSVAASLDGFIAGPKGEHDWIARDSGIDFAALYRRFDTLVMGRRTYDVARTNPGLLAGMGMKIVVVSTTLDSAEHGGAIVVNHTDAVAALKAEPGKDIWLFGGSVLFRSLLDFGLVDELSVSVFPVMLGAGIPLLPKGSRLRLKLNESKALPSGVLLLNYSVTRPE
jgi:dihydrofolate reductase